MSGRGGGDRVKYGAAVAVLVVLYVGLRITLPTSSYDAVSNWEEPVFLFSGLELARDGLGQVFDHQDDLNHGGSVVLLVLMVPWIRLVGTSLVALKGLALAWSTLTLIAFVAVGWRHWSARVALWFGLCFALASPAFARLNVTLVASHPESLLPVALALDAYLTWLRKRREGRRDSVWSNVLLGLWSGLAMWISYVSTLFIAPILMCRALAGADPRRLSIVGLGWILGVVPWMAQNLWLRPQGAWLWRSHVANEPARDWLNDGARIVRELAASFGWVSPGGECILAACGAVLFMLTIEVIRGRDPDLRERRWELLPFVAAPYLGFVMLLAARIAPTPAEGYYYARFYVALQVALFWVLVLGGERWTKLMPQGVVAAIVVVLASGALTGQVRLLGQGTSYTADVEVDRSQGCLVFGVAEADRSSDWAAAANRLRDIDDARCRNRAFSGLGWGIGSRFLATHDVGAARAALRSITDPQFRWATCGGFHFLVHHTASPMSTALFDEVGIMLRRTCERPPA